MSAAFEFSADEELRAELREWLAENPPPAIEVVATREDADALRAWQRTLQAGYVPAEVAPEVRGDEQALSLWEFRDEDGRRVGLRVLLAPADAWVQEPRA